MEKTKRQMMIMPRAAAPGKLPGKLLHRQADRPTESVQERQPPCEGDLRWRFIRQGMPLEAVRIWLTGESYILGYQMLLCDGAQWLAIVYDSSLRFDGRSTGARLLIKGRRGHSDVTR